MRYDAPMEPPIACTLTEAEMRERRRTILDSVRGVTGAHEAKGVIADFFGA